MLSQRTHWIDFAAFDAVTLRSGTTYYLTFSAPSGTSYLTTTLRDGNRALNGACGWSADVVFKDGHAEFNDGSGWSDWLAWGKPKNDSDLSFFFSS